VQQCPRFRGNAAGPDVRVVDDRPDRVASLARRYDLADLRLLAAATGPQPQAADALRVLARAVSGILSAAVALADSGLIIIGGSWGIHPVILEAITAEAARLPRPIPVRAATLTDEPALTGARTDALGRLRSRIVATDFETVRVTPQR
jgi:predicted NBD/HSP70 family sugar kinase